MIREIQKGEGNIVDNLLTKLIKSEKEFDSNINENFIVNNYYENIIGKDYNKIFVVLDDNKIVGYLYGFLEENEAIIKKVGHLDALYIEEDYRNKGYARKLINEFKNYCMKNDVAYIEVKALSNNIKAVNLYTSEDFTELKKIFKYEDFSK